RTSSARAMTKGSNPALGGSTPSSACGRAMRPRCGSHVTSRRACSAAPAIAPGPPRCSGWPERHLFFDLEPAQPHPLVPLGALGLCAGAALSARAGSDRERAVDEASAELLRHCGQASLRGFSPDQREAWRRVAPILTLFDLGAWL